jgi:hypothetical protein
MILMIVILGFAVVRLIRRPPRGDIAATVAPKVGSPDRGSESLNAQRYRVLVRAFTGTYDLSSSEVVKAHVQKSLRAVGITPITPGPGDPFDVGLHNGVAGITAPAPSLVFRIARVLRPGWRSDEGFLRPADVEVYKDEIT